MGDPMTNANTMLWGSTAAAVVEDSFRRAKNEAESLRQREAERRIDILEEDWRDLLLGYVGRVFKDPNVYADLYELASTEHNVFKRIVTELSTVYKGPATRECADTNQNRLANMMWDEAQIDEVLEQGNIYLNGLRDIIIVPQVVDGEARIEIITPNRVSVRQHPVDVTRAEAFWWTRTRNNTLDSYVIETVYADETYWIIYDQDRKILKKWEHGIGGLPGIVVHAEKRFDTFWGPTGLESVVEANYNVALLLAGLRRLSKWQSELQITHSGEREEMAKPKPLGAHMLLSAGVGGSYGVLSTQATPEHYISHINATIGWIAEMHGMSADTYKLADGGGSGLQFRLRRQPLLEARAKQAKLWRRVERALYALMCKVMQREHPVLYGLDPSAPFSVNFQDDPGIEDPATQNKIWQERIDMGVMSQVGVLMEMDPDLTRDQAVEKLKQISEERGIWADIVRRLEIKQGAGGPGPSPAQNGAQGGATKAANAMVDKGIVGTEFAKLDPNTTDGGGNDVAPA